MNIKLDSATIKVIKNDCLPSNGIKNDHYHLNNVSIAFLEGDLIRVIGTQEIWSYWTFLNFHLGSALFRYSELSESDLEKLKIPPYPNWPYGTRKVAVPWYDRIFGGPSIRTEKVYYEGWFKTGEQPFDFVIHSSRLTGHGFLFDKNP